MKAAIGRKPHLRPGWLNPRRRIFIPSITGREQGVLPATEDGHKLPDIIALPGGRYCLIHDHRDKHKGRDKHPYGAKSGGYTPNGRSPCHRDGNCQ